MFNVASSLLVRCWTMQILRAPIFRFQPCPAAMVKEGVELHLSTTARAPDRRSAWKRDGNDRVQPGEKRGSTESAETRLI